VISRDVAYYAAARRWATTRFFVIVASLFRWADLSPNCCAMAPGIVVGGLPAYAVAGRLFAADYLTAVWNNWCWRPTRWPWWSSARSWHWLVSGLPLVLISPVIALQFDLPAEAIATLLLALLLGTPLLSLIGAIGAALTVGVRGGGVLVSLLVLPLYVPVLIFGAGAVDASASGMDAGGHLSILGALLLLGMALAPWATSAALRISLE
jgi:heme exporter protein B